RGILPNQEAVRQRILRGFIVSSNSNSGPAAAKVCVQCKRDCSSRPRLKDSRGRYHCRECVDKATAANNAPPASAVEPTEPIYDALDEPLALAPEGEPDNNGGLAGTVFEGGIRPCPVCTRPLARSDVICIGCGYNAATGQKIATDRGAPSPPGAPGRASNCVK